MNPAGSLAGPGVPSPGVVRPPHGDDASDAPRAAEGEATVVIPAPAPGRWLDSARRAEREGRWEAARLRYEAALRDPEHIEVAGGTSTLIRWVGRTYLEEGNLEAAVDCFEAALAAARSSGDASAEAHAVNCLGITLQRRGKLDGAEARYRSALLTARRAGDVQVTAMVEQNLGTVAAVRGDVKAALKRYRSSLASYRVLELVEYQAPLLANLAMLHGRLGEFDEAERLYEEAYRQAAGRGAAATRVAIQVYRVELWIARGDHHRAREECDQAFELSAHLGSDRLQGEIHKHYGVIHRETGKLRLAEEHLTRAEALARRAEDALLAAEAARELAELYRMEERYRETLQSLRRAQRGFSNLRAGPDVADVRRRLEQLEGFFLDIVRRWGDSIESKDRYTQGHCKRVAAHACALASAAGMEPAELIWFRMGALLHDVGKVIVPSEILNKPGPLTAEEQVVMKRHPGAGADLLADIEFPWDIRPMVRHHHERWDGEGYPEGLAGTSIPFSARILCIADVFDALTTQRSYRPPYSEAEAIVIMARESGRAFDPELFRLFLEVLAEGALAPALHLADASRDVPRHLPPNGPPAPAHPPLRGTPPRPVAPRPAAPGAPALEPPLQASEPGSIFH